MTRLHRFAVCLLCFVFSLFMAASPALAERYAATTLPDGREFFRFRILDPGESFRHPQAGLLVSTWAISDPMAGSLLSAGNYWTDLIGMGAKNTTPIFVAIRGDDTLLNNATGGSMLIDSGPYANMFRASAAALEGWQGERPYGYITIGMPNSAWFGPLEVLTHNGDAVNMATLLAHEFSHVMGFLSLRRSDDGGATYHFDSVLSAWDTHLYDSLGNAAEPDKTISPMPGNVFCVFPNDYAYFQGPATLSVLSDGGAPNGILPGSSVAGVPVTGWELGFPDLQHSELRNSMMSHQPYRNWGVLMEAELAMLQDLGYTIDRKNFFGFSVYGDSQTFDNTSGYSARLAGAYLPGVPNPTVAGVGLHIYGNGNTVTQRADILSSGFGAAGIRVDGLRGNTVIIPSDIRVHADGELGTGLMVTYGSEHSIIHQGDLRALGPGGVGARFDFGSTVFGLTANMEYRGSFINAEISGGAWVNRDIEYNTGLAGPLLSSFDVSGRIAGAAAAIYISDNAYVERINIMRGASLTGDIISFWDPLGNPLLQNVWVEDSSGLSDPLDPSTLMTDLSFGLLAGAGGAATSTPDSDFDLLYLGRITGPGSLEMRVAGGALAFGGAADVRSFRLANGAQLDAVLGGYTTTITAAADIALESGSRIGVRPGPFTYGPKLPSVHTVLAFEAPGFSNGAAIVPSSGSFAVGPWEYSYGNVRYLDAKRVGIDTRARFNHLRGGTDAQNAPLAMVMRAPGVDAVNDHLTRAFALGKEGFQALREDWNAPLALMLGGFSFSGESREGFFREPKRFGPDFADTRAYGVNWFPLDSGGWEGGSGPVSLWVSPAYSVTSRHGGRHYDIHGPHGAAGIDYRLADRCIVGVAVHADFPTYSSRDADIDGSGVTGILYSGLLLPWGAELGLNVSFGKTIFDLKRDTPGGSLSSDYHAEVLGLGAHISRPLLVTENVLLRPFASWDYFHVNRSSYDEGESLYALSYDSSQSDLHRLRAGMEAAYSFGDAVLSGKVFWSGLRGDTTEDVRASFVMDPARNEFEAPVAGLDRDSLGLAANFACRLGDSTEARIGYTYLGGRNSDTHQGTFNLVFRF